MNFARYKELASKVLPQYAAQLTMMDDSERTHAVVGCWCASVDVSTLTDFGRVDLFSLTNMADSQVRHWKEFGQSFWKKDKVRVQ